MQVKYNVHDRAVVITNPYLNPTLNVHDSAVVKMEPYLNPTLNVHDSAVVIMEVGVRVTGSCEVREVE